MCIMLKFDPDITGPESIHQGGGKTELKVDLSSTDKNTAHYRTFDLLLIFPPMSPPQHNVC